MCWCRLRLGPRRISAVLSLRTEVWSVARKLPRVWVGRNSSGSFGCGLRPSLRMTDLFAAGGGVGVLCGCQIYSLEPVRELWDFYRGMLIESSDPLAAKP